MATSTAGDVARSARQDVRTRQLLDATATLMQQKGSYNVSMKAIADQAGLSVGLIYRYYDNKEALVRAVIVGVLDQMTHALSDVLEPSDDPVRRVAAAFTAYAGVIRDNRQAALLTYRETHMLDNDSQRLVMDMEVQTAEPLRLAAQEAVDVGLFRDLDVDVFSYDLLVIAHSWALKHWYYAERMGFEEFVAKQLAFVLAGALKPEHHDTYRDLLTPA